MAPAPSGSVYRMKSGWGVRYRTASGSQKRASGFKTERAAQRFLLDKLDQVAREKRGEVIERPREIPTLAEAIDAYLAHHEGECESNTLRVLKQRLGYSLRKFGDLPLNRIDAGEIVLWRRTLPAGSAASIVRALSQVFAHYARADVIAKNPVKDPRVKNPNPRRREVAILSPEQVASVDRELPTHLRGLAVFASHTGLRPSEWIPLERGDIAREHGLVHIRRTYRDGELREGRGKTRGSVPRVVPLPAVALAALDARPARLDTRLVWPGKRGDYLNLNDFRRTWKSALIAAGIQHHTIYSMRHSFASWVIAGGCDLFTLARMMGTSVSQIEATYGHLTPSAHDRLRAALEAFGS